MLKRLMTLAGAGLLAASAAAQTGMPEPSLQVGDEAPALEHVNWLHGDPISEYESGQIYVLDFWATWCGPCIRAMPTIKELHNEYADDGVNIVGVAIWPREQMAPTADWVEEREDEIPYRMAEDIENKTADAFMRAAGRNGIPTVMVVDGAGKLAWMGHPMSGLGDVLEKMVAGEWDADSYAEMQRRQAEVEQKSQGLMREFQAAMMAESWDKVASVADELYALDEQQFKPALIYKYVALVMGEKGEEADRLGTDMVTGVFAGDAQALDNLAWIIVGPDSPMSMEQRDLELAVTAADRSIEVQGGPAPSALDTKARALFLMERHEDAVATQKDALAALEERFGGQPGYESMRGELQTRLTEYESALETAGTE